MKLLPNKFISALALLAVCAGPVFFDAGAWAHVITAQSEHTKVTLLPQHDALKPGREATFGFLLEMQEHWHVYWRNPGDSGFPVVIEWILPEGYTSDGITWPNPKRIVIDPLTSYGYEGTTLLLSRVRVPDTAQAGTQVSFGIDMKWLECRIECVPGTARFDFTMPVADDPRPDVLFQTHFEQYQGEYPLSSDELDVEGLEGGGKIVIRSMDKSIVGMNFFPYENGLIDNHAAQAFMRQASGSQVVIDKSPTAGYGFLEKIEGLLIVTTDNAPSRSYEVSLNLRPLPDDVPAVLIHAQQNPLIVSLFAFLGGLILNLMPCVLPVLSIKILSLVEASHKGARSVLIDGLSFAFGILVSFWFLAFFMIALKSAGHFVGWGFQFQSPVFVVFMATLFFWMGLNLFGIFEVDLGAARVQNIVRNSFLLKNPFLNGVLATVVATPCTAPFMGTALGYALSQPAMMTFVIFTSLGLGLASPYVILSLKPGWLKVIPKPGPWMITMKNFFGLMFMASTLWLAWVLDVQRGSAAVAMLFVGLLIIGVAGWVIGRFAAVSQQAFRRWRARIVAILLFLAGFGLALYGTTLEPFVKSPSQKEGAIAWVEFSQERLSQLRREGKAVFIDFTASWCLSCQVNERVAIYHPGVIASIEEKGIVMMKADWTNYDASITSALESFGRNSIPVYVIYAPGSQEPVFLPELLTPGIVIDALDKI